jgi:DNA-binding response OmpR family regulator
MTSKLLIVDDEPSIAATMEAALTREGYDLDFADRYYFAGCDDAGHGWF